MQCPKDKPRIPFSIERPSISYTSSVLFSVSISNPTQPETLTPTPLWVMNLSVRLLKLSSKAQSLKIEGKKKERKRKRAGASGKMLFWGLSHWNRPCTD